MSKITENLCRICLKCENDSKNSIFNVQFDGFLAIDVMNSLFEIGISSAIQYMPNVPRMICTPCQKLIKFGLKLKTLARKSHQWLDSMNEQLPTVMVLDSDDEDLEDLLEAEEVNLSHLTVGNVIEIGYETSSAEETEDCLDEIQAFNLLSQTPLRPEISSLSSATTATAFSGETNFFGCEEEVTSSLVSSSSCSSENKGIKRKIHKSVLLATENLTKQVVDSKQTKGPRLISNERQSGGINEKDLFICDVCKKHLRNKCHLVLHLYSHFNIRKFQCRNCQKKFFRKSHLDGHILSHSGEKPFSCSKCNKKFSQICNLNTHMSTHSDQKPFSCEKCGKRYKTRGSIHNHVVKIHGRDAVKSSILKITATLQQ